jgi:hypothetical protein
MLSFPIVDLMDEQKCYDWLVTVLHPKGLSCSRCRRSVAEARVHRRDRAPVWYYRCICGRVYNAFAGTLWQGTQRPCSQIVAILQGLTQGQSTSHLAQELGASYPHLLELRHRLQANAHAGCPTEALPDKVVEVDEMYQNAGEKRRAAPQSRRSAAAARQQSPRPRHVG